MIGKTETYEVTPDQPLHGYSGPLRVSHGGAFTNVGQQWLDVAAKYDKERAHTSDVNALHSCNEYGVSAHVFRTMMDSDSVMWV
jgi:alcohol oxidase